MLELVRPRELDAERVSIGFAGGGLELELPHATEPEWSIAALVTAGGAVVDIGSTHEHFDADDGDRRWPSQAVDFIAEILRGDIEIESEYRGKTLIRTRHFLTDSDGQRHELGTTGLLRPALLMVWKPSRTEVFGSRFNVKAEERPHAPLKAAHGVPAARETNGVDTDRPSKSAYRLRFVCGQADGIRLRRVRAPDPRPWTTVCVK